MQTRASTAGRQVTYLARRFFRVSLWLLGIFAAALVVIASAPIGPIFIGFATGIVACASLAGSVIGPFITVYLLIWEGAALLAWAYVKVFGSIPAWVCSRLGFDLAAGAQLAVQLAGKLTLALLTVGTVVVVFTSTRYQSETMRTIDNVHCSTALFLRVIFETINDIADWYEAGVHEVNVILGILWDALATIVGKLYSYAIRILNIVVRVVSGDIDNIACVAFGGNAKQPLCTNDGCAIRDALCVLEDAYFFFVNDIIRPVLLAIVGPGPTGVVVEGFTGLLASLRLGLDIVLTMINPGIDTGAAIVLPSSFPSRAQSLAQMQNINISVFSRYVYMWAFWINLLFASVTNLIEFGYALLTMVLGPTFTGYIRSFFQYLATIINIIVNFATVVTNMILDVIAPIIAPIMPAINQLREWVGQLSGAINAIRRLIRRFTALPSGLDWVSALASAHGHTDERAAVLIGGTIDEVYALQPFIEMANGTLRTDCGLSAACAAQLAGGIPHAVRALFVATDPTIDQLLAVEGGACVVQYYRTTQACRHYKAWASWPLYHLMTGSTWLEPNDRCKAVLETEALTRLPPPGPGWSSSDGASVGWSASGSPTTQDIGDLLTAAGAWWIETYAPCVYHYTSAFGAEQTLLPWPDGDKAELAARLVNADGSPLVYPRPLAFLAGDAAPTQHLARTAVHAGLSGARAQAATPNWLPGLIGWHGDVFIHAERDAAHAHTFLGPRKHYVHGHASEHAAGHADARLPSAGPAEVGAALTRLRGAWSRVYAGKYTTGSRVYTTLAESTSAPVRRTAVRLRPGNPAARRTLALNPRDFNFNDDVTRPAGRKLLNAVIVLLRLLRNIAGRLPYVGDATAALIVWVEEADYLTFLDSLILFIEEDVVQMLRDKFYCGLGSGKYDPRRCPNCPYELTCVLWLRLPPKGIRAPSDWDLRRPNYGVPCATTATTCVYDPAVPKPGSIFSGLPITGRYPALVRLPCDRYVHCSVYGLDEPFDVFIYLVELISVSGPLDFIGWLRSGTVSRVIVFTLNVVGSVLYVLLAPLGWGSVGSNLVGYSNTREVPGLGPILFRFADSFEQSPAHSGCLAWNIWLITTAIVVILFASVMVFHLLPAFANFTWTVGAAAAAASPALIPAFLAEQALDDELQPLLEDTVCTPIVVDRTLVPSGKSD